MAPRVPAPADTWRLRTLPGGVSVPSPLRGPDSTWGSGTPWEVRGPRLFWLSSPFSGTRGVTGPFPSKGRVRDRWPGEMEPDPRGPAVQPLRA